MCVWRHRPYPTQIAQAAYAGAFAVFFCFDTTTVMFFLNLYSMFCKYHNCLSDSLYTFDDFLINLVNINIGNPIAIIEFTYRCYN